MTAQSLTNAQRLSRLRAGKAKADARKRRESIARVKAYQAWLAWVLEADRRGVPFVAQLRRMPEIPSDHDYRVANHG